MDGYGDAWENETFTVTNVDLENLSGDFVALNFEYYADTFYEVDSQGNIDPSDYLALYADLLTGELPMSPSSMGSGVITTRMEHVRKIEMVMELLMPLSRLTLAKLIS